MTVTEATDRLVAAGADDEKITLATVDLAVAVYPEGHQEQLRAAVFAAAIPHWFDGTILSCLLAIAPEEAESLFSELKNFTFVERHLPRNAWNIHERSRSHLLAFFYREHCDTYRDFSKRAAKVFDDGSESHMRIESIYHLLVAESEGGSVVLAEQYDQWNTQGRVEPLQALAAMLDEHLAANRLAGRALAMTLDVTATIQRSYRPLSHIETRLKQAQNIFQELNDDHGQSLILDELGDVQLNQGHPKDALDSFRGSLVLRKKLAANDPQDTDAQRNLSVSHERIGSVQHRQGQWEEALGSFQAALVIREKLAALDPQNTQFQHDLSVAHERIGTVQRDQGRSEEALSSFQALLIIREKLAALDPQNIKWQRDLSVSYDRIGDVQRNQGHPEDALSSFHASLAIREKLTADDQQNTLWQRDLAISHNKIGEVQRAEGHLDKALSSFHAGLIIAQRLTAHDLQNTLWQRDLCFSYNSVGHVQFAQGLLDEALQSFQMALGIAEKLAKHDPHNTEWGRDLEFSRAYIAAVTEALSVRRQPPV